MSKSFFQTGISVVFVNILLQVGFITAIHFPGLFNEGFPGLTNALVAVGIGFLLATSIVLRYYRSKGFHASFYLAAAIGANYILVLYFIGALPENFDVLPMIIFLQYLLVALEIVYAITLFASQAKQQPWLRYWGYSLLALLLAGLIIDEQVSSFRVAYAAELRMFIDYATALSPVLLLLNFSAELKARRFVNDEIVDS